MLKGYWNVPAILALVIALFVDLQGRIESGESIFATVVAVVAALVMSYRKDTDGDGTPDVRDRTPNGGE